MYMYVTLVSCMPLICAIYYKVRVKKKNSHNKSICTLPKHVCYWYPEEHHMQLLGGFLLNLHLEPAEFQAVVKWWLGIAVIDLFFAYPMKGTI